MKFLLGMAAATLLVASNAQRTSGGDPISGYEDHVRSLKRGQKNRRGKAGRRGGRGGSIFPNGLYTLEVDVIDNKLETPIQI